MKRLIPLIILLCQTSLFATAQFPDSLIYKGETVSVFSNPLESFFNADNPRPRDLFKASCTACWRGYIASWEVKDGKLYLIKVIEGTCSRDAQEIDMTGVFKGGLPVEAVWFTGVLRIPRGKRLYYVHMGYGSVYEKDLFLTFEKGRLVNEVLVDNTKRKRGSNDREFIQD